MLVDDDETLRRLGARMLERLGYSVDTFACGEHAVTACSERANRAYEVAIVDMKMPGMGGIRTAQALIGASPTTRVVLSSGYSRQDTLDQWSGPPIEFLRKPYSLTALDQLLVRLTSNQ